MAQMVWQRHRSARLGVITEDKQSPHLLIYGESHIFHIGRIISSTPEKSLQVRTSQRHLIRLDTSACEK